MKEFFVKFSVKGVKIILAVAIIWIIYFIINFLDPTLFNFLRVNNKNVVATSTPPTNKSLGYKIYGMFFKSKSTAPKEVASSSETISKNLWNSTSSEVWGGGFANVWGGTQSNSQNALEGQTFVSPNTSKSPISGMKINALLVNANNFNYLPDGATISGKIHTVFLNSYYFNADIYDTNGILLFSLPITSNHDINNNAFSNFYGQYNANLNYTNYKGEAYMLIKSDDQSVTESVMIKILLK